MIEEKLKNGAKILSLKAKDIAQSIEMSGQYSFTYTNRQGKCCARDKSKLYNGTLDYSLELLKLYELAPKGFVLRKPEDKQVSTNIIVNVDFTSNYWEYSASKPKWVYNKKDDELKALPGAVGIKKDKTTLRNQLYRDGFKLNGKKYIFYKRSSSHARAGHALFIQQKYHKPMMEWSHFGLDFGKNGAFDFASLKSYEALTLSGITSLISIDPQSILLIDDFKTILKAPASVTRVKDGEITASDEDEFAYESSLWDGQSLLDESIVPEPTEEEAKKGKTKKCMWQLRGRFFKTAAFSAKIQKYFQDRCAADGIDYETAVVYDMFQRPMLLKDVCCITCPSSLKFLKFSDFVSDKNTESEQQKKAYEFWLNHISSEFGVCKNEKASVYGDVRCTSYQMLQSLDLNEQDISVLLEEEFKYIRLLKSNPDVFRWHCNLYNASPSEGMISFLIAHVPGIEKTKLYYEFVNDSVRRYENSLLQGKIKLLNTDYSTLIGNPVEMLQSAYGDEIVQSIHQDKYDVWCPMFQNNQYLFGSRNPQITMGNISYLHNVYHPEFEYINLTDRIVIINNYNSDIQARLQGADQDSDTILLSAYPLMVEKAKEVQQFRIPVKDIKLDKTYRNYTLAESAAIDDVIANNRIGVIVDDSQTLNSWYWHCKYHGADKETLKQIYDMVSILSSVSQCELDRCKKYFEETTVPIDTVLKKVKSMQVNGERLFPREKLEVKSKSLTDDTKSKIKKLQKMRNDNEISGDEYKLKVKETCDGNVINKRQINKPTFFLNRGKKNQLYSGLALCCPMNSLTKYVSESERKRAKPSNERRVPLNKFLVSIKGHNDDRHRIPVLWGLAYEADQKIKALILNKDMSSEEKQKRKKEVLQDLSDDFASRKIKIEDVSKIIRQAFFDLDLPKEKRKNETIEYTRNDGKKIFIKCSELRMRMISALYASHPEFVEACFQVANCGGKKKMLYESDAGAITIWGKKYKIA